MSIGHNYQKAISAQSNTSLLKSLLGAKDPKGNSHFAQTRTTSEDSSTPRADKQITASTRNTGNQRSGDKPNIDLEQAQKGLDTDAKLAGNTNKGCPNCGSGACSCKNCNCG